MVTWDDVLFDFIVISAVCLLVGTIATPINYEIIDEDYIRTNTHTIIFDDKIWTIRVDTAATDSMHNAWKNNAN